MTSMNRWLQVTLALVCLELVWAPRACPTWAQDGSVKPDLSQWVRTQSGELPIIISAPHGGTGTIPGVQERKGEGMATGAAGFFTGRDSGTEELATEVSNAIEKRFGKRPYLVASRVHRKYLDPNRPAEIAFEDTKVSPIYKHYHESMAEYCRDVTEKYRSGIVIDLHGQGTKRDTVFRGTKNGATVTHLRETFGEGAHTSSGSLFGLLQSRGWIVHPSPLDGKEQSGFTGGYIVQTYGSQKGSPIDAMQLEFGAEYRVQSRRTQTAAELAEALAEYATTFLKVDVPVPLSNSNRNQTRPLEATK